MLSPIPFTNTKSYPVRRSSSSVPTSYTFTLGLSFALAMLPIEMVWKFTNATRVTPNQVLYIHTPDSTTASTIEIDSIFFFIFICLKFQQIRQVDAQRAHHLDAPLRDDRGVGGGVLRLEIHQVVQSQRQPESAGEPRSEVEV